jgi:Mn2+/Fe2+ NRAMP family transporter
LNFTPIDPVQALFWSAVINGVVAGPVMIIVMLLASNSKVMGDFTISFWLKLVGWAATAVMIIAAIGLFATWGRT